MWPAASARRSSCRKLRPDQGDAQGRPYEHPWAADGPYWNLRGNGGMLSTPRDMFRWHVALRGDAILSEQAKKQLFHPYAPTPDEGESYGYGWLMLDTDDGPIAEHDGGNGWSLADFARSPRGDVMVFWVSDHAYQDDAWNLDDIERKLTLGIACRARAASSAAVTR